MSKNNENKKSNQKTTLKKVLKRIKPYSFLVICSLVMAAATVALTLYFPLLTGDAIDYILEPGKVDFNAIIPILKKLAVIAIITAVCQWIMNVCNNHITYNVTKDIRDEAFKKIEILPLRYIDDHSYGDIVSRVIADVDQFADGLLMGFTQLFTGVLTILGTLIFMFRENVTITFVVLLVTPVSLFVAAFIAKKTYRYFKLQSETRGEETALIDEMINNQNVVQAFSQQKNTLDKFDEINNRLEKVSLNATFFSSLVNPSTRFVNSLVYTSVGIVGALSVIGGRLSVGQLSCFLSYANQYTKPFNEISGVVTELQNALACAARIFELIEEEPQTPDKENARVLDEADGTLSLENVAFSYVSDRKLIENLNLNVKSGQRVAIVGPTGCGKTTLINLLMRFYDVDDGSIKVSGTDIRDITRKSLRSNYGMVLQDTWLKTGTIRENIVMGKPDATDEEVIAAAKASHADSFIRRLSDGYDTFITEDGGNLSQGQKQLLCITRVMLCLPPMLILDEATSSIDTRTELKIQHAFSTMMKGRTSFIIAHRLSTIQDADVILVMKDGHIIEQGNHEELLAKNGFYAKLYNSQFSL
ncbi:ABC transporter ATP-binding protein [Anaerotignum sp. MSJ-24]|uniref:ABC transporter ATP-binding protein n=1 Tax=Anaerotignum sp. MSJ-24 TaxID=2841521 RepID=UPI001C118BD6|nr:ABC transporter ATP-binding protein [Anaerotignum sp. MSJ-24]MBU5463542.1 ABC transporter ATP-binding protein/permease [Anaerotignum sp. MSJ-24]